MLGPLAGTPGPLWVPRRAAVAPTFDPASIAGLQLWLAADSGVYSDAAGTTPAADGDPVALWRDRSPSARDAAQPTAGSRPTLAAAAIGGRPAVRFDGSARNLPFAALAITGPITVIAACSRTSSAASLVPVGGSLYYNSVTIRGNGNGEFGGNDGGGVAVGYGSATAPGLVCWRRDADNLCSIDRNDTTVGGPVGYGAGGFDLDRVGSRNGSDSLYSSGDFAEILVYAADLDASQRSDVFAYLNGRYGLY